MVFRLEEEVSKEEEIHERAMAELAQPIEITPSHLEENQEGEGPSYAAQVEQLQMKVYNYVGKKKIVPLYALFLNRLLMNKRLLPK